MKKNNNKKEVPFLFSTPMVQSILNGTKTMTRRAIKENIYFDDGKALLTKNHKKLKPKAKVGDIIWVRETFIDLVKSPVLGAGSEKYKGLKYWYKADNYINKEMKVCGTWKPSLFMPRVAARLFLRVTDVRIEELQDISEEDAKREGIERIFSEFRQKELYKNYLANSKDKDDTFFFTSAIDSFNSLWTSINGNDSYVDNPNVFVYTFERIENYK